MMCRYWRAAFLHPCPLDENNMEEVKTKLDMLEKAAMQAGQAMYNQPNGDTASQSTQTHSGDDVVDGEFTEK